MGKELGGVLDFRFTKATNKSTKMLETQLSVFFDFSSIIDPLVNISTVFHYPLADINRPSY
jgi:hypothetical protein